VRRADEEVVTAIYPAIQQFLGSARGGIGGALVLGFPDPSDT
jgi:hypothetical protein